MTQFHHSLAMAVLALAGVCAHAERADRDKPMTIESDALRYDDQKQTSTFSGRVTVNKGTIVMRGARMEVRQDPQGHQFGTLTAETGQRAFFRQKREGVDEYIEGEAERIEYDGQADSVRFIRVAELRRFRGTALSDEVTGNLIVYDNKTEKFTVDGVPDAPGGAGRVRAVLSPQPAASAPSAPASAPSGPGLRPSVTLGGARP